MPAKKTEPKKKIAKGAETAAKPPSFRNLMTFRLHLVARLSERFSEQYYRKHMDLSLPECRVIGITAGYGSVSFKRVAAEANLEKSYASRVVSALVERGLIERLSNPSDSRSVLLELTERGRGVHKEMYALALKLNENLCEQFSKEEVDAFVSFLTSLEQQIRRNEDMNESDDEWRPSPTPAPAAAAAAPSTKGQPAPLDRAFASQLRDLLERYLETEK